MLSWELISPEEAIHFAKRRDSPFNAHLFLPLFVGFDSLILKVIKTVTILESVCGQCSQEAGGRRWQTGSQVVRTSKTQIGRAHV